MTSSAEQNDHKYNSIKYLELHFPEQPLKEKFKMERAVNQQDIHTSKGQNIYKYI